MMEVDMQSSPSTFRPVGYTIKRPRSPGSPSQERQAKRLTLAPVSEGLCVRRAADAVLDNGRLGNQDDWVRQARELTIGSPLAVVGFPSIVDGGATPGQSRADENMAIDYEESQSIRAHAHLSASRQWTASKSHLPPIHITTTSTPVVNDVHAPSPAPFSVLTEPPSSSTESASSASSAPAREVRVGVNAPQPHHPPDIFLFPATPSDTSSHQHHFISEFGPADEDGGVRCHARMQDHGQTHSHNTLAPDRIEGSPRPSKSSDMPTSSGRKHRVTMGPRADCVKCRTGVKGHWMHFD